MAGRLEPSIDHYGYKTGAIFAITPSCPFWVGHLFNAAPDAQAVHEELARTDLTVKYMGHKNWRVRIYDIRLSVFLSEFSPYLPALSCPHVMAGLAVAL